MTDDIPEKQLALLGWGLLAVKSADSGKEYHHMVGRYQGYREAVESLRNEDVGWPEYPELEQAYIDVGRAIVAADDIENTIGQGIDEVSVQ